MDRGQQRFWDYYNASLNWKDRLLAGEQMVNDRLTVGVALSSKLTKGQLNIDHQPFGNQMDRRTGDQIGGQSDSRTTETVLAAESEESVSDEFLAFIAQTRKHQLEREKRRQELALQEEQVEYKDLTEVENRTKLIGLKEPEPREDLYGEQAEEIFSKELKLQFSFNEFCDKNQPKFWPMIPINLSIKQ